jgi:hypothetical protein
MLDLATGWFLGIGALEEVECVFFSFSVEDC